MKNKHLLPVCTIVALCFSWFLISYLTDGPGVFDDVFLDIRSVEVLVDTSANTRVHDSCNWDAMGDPNRRPDSSFVWENLGVKAGVYDIMQLRNGADTLLASASIKLGAIRLIRIELGTNNSLVKDSVSYPLNLVPGLPPYILVKLTGNEWERTASNASRLWLDFDVQRSIIQVRNNAFYLSPVIHVFVVSKTGTVTGTILPRDAWPEVVSLYNSTDTAYAITNRDGMFLIRGLKDGVYSALYNASNGYKDTTVSNIKISNASTFSIGAVTLHK
jgi:hypothetical protein